jgi:hypothetical protein
MLTLIGYDISEPKRLARVARVCEDFGVRQLVREGDGEAARSGADVDDAQLRARSAGFEIDLDAARAQPLERNFDDVFRFRARDEHCWSHFEFEAPEFLLAREVLRRFARGSAGDEREILARGIRIERRFGVGIEPCAVAAERVQKQEFRCERVGGNLRGAQAGDSFFQGCAKIHPFTVLNELRR